MKVIFWFISQSLILDFGLFRVSSWSFSKKLNFLFIKYQLIIRHFFKDFELGHSNVRLFNKTIYYDSKYGIAGYESLLARHQKLLKLNDIKNVNNVIDIGANVGYFSLLIKDMYPNATTFSFDPIPTTFSCLEKNLSVYQNAKVYNCAVGDEVGKALFEFDANNSALSKVSPTGTLEIPVTTLDTFVNENNLALIDILKIDTETFEQHVLKGAKSALKNVRYILIEITLDDNPNYTISSLLSNLYSEEYDFDLVGFRNYADTAVGEIPILDALLMNRSMLCQ